MQQTDEDDPFPKKPSGVTDWEKLFEDPEVGYFPRIESAPDARELRHETTVIVQRLFTRRGDDGQINRFLKELAVLIPDETTPEHLPEAKQAIIKILGELKNHRIAKADAYEREKAEASETTADTKSQARKRREEDKRRQRIFTFVSGAAVAAVAGLLLLVFIRPWEKEDILPVKQLVLEMEQIAQAPDRTAEGPAVSHVFGGTLVRSHIGGKLAISANGIPVDKCRSVAWVLVNKGQVVINGFLPERVTISTLETLCKEDPTGATVVWVPK